LREVLVRSGHAAGEVDDALRRLRSAGALDDRRLAERFARSRIAHAGLGGRRVRQALRVRGVAREDAERGLQAALELVSETDALDRLARAYWKRHARVDPAGRVARLWAFLVRRGFAPAAVHQRLSALWPRWREALDGLEPPEAEGTELGDNSGD
jgi:SOS response regulatory protein OraA/RecX